MDIDILYCCVECGTWWIAIRRENSFHQAYDIYNGPQGITFAPMHCNMPMRIVRRDERITVIPTDTTAPTIIDAPTGDTMPIPAMMDITVFSLPAVGTDIGSQTPAASLRQPQFKPPLVRKAS